MCDVCSVKALMKTGWQGFLSFSFVKEGEKTVIRDKKHFGPLVLQRPYYQELDRPSVLVLHPPGGVVGGDSLELKVRFLPGAKGSVSTPAATKFYRSDGRLATQVQTLTLSQGVEAEWLPQETLFFNQSNVQNTLKIMLEDAHNKFIAWDLTGLGRPASSEGFEQGQLQQTLELWIDNQLFFLDRMQLTPQSPLLNSACGLSGQTLFATALFYQPDEAKQKNLLVALQAVDWPLSVGVTQLGALVVLRVLATELDEIKQVLWMAWGLARPLILGCPVVKPRIWNT